MPYFFDSYAIIEMVKRSQQFAVYLDEKITVTILNVIEIAQYFLINAGEEKAKKICDILSENVVELRNTDILIAVTFRTDHKKKSLSYADCIGYTYAKQHGLIFLTGDDAFKDMPNVEFVK